MLTMCLHELATNAAKYGALSAQAGRVTVGWDLAANAGERKVCLAWNETGGPRVAAPPRKGFGSRLIEQSFQSEGGAQLHFEPHGVRCLLSIRLG
jgi:two-component sensor histidine kinase